MKEIQATITGMVLAGGRARRMGGSDKGLIEFSGKPLITYALSALLPMVSQVLINANRNHDLYASLGFPVVSDHSVDFDGPLAGILSGMEYCTSQYLLTVPCDCPMITEQALARMPRAMKNSNSDCFVASDGHRLHPVFLLLDCGLAESLRTYLRQGHRKIDTWLYQQRLCEVDFSDQPEIFRNINTPEELAILEKEYLAYGMLK